MKSSDVVAFAKSQGWDGAVKAPRRFLGCDVWEATLNNVDPGNPPAICIPLIFLVNGGSIRPATVDETFAWMASQPDDEDKDSDVL